MPGRRLALFCLAAFAVLVLVPAAASAANRYASPVGTGGEPCSSSDPVAACPISTAVDGAGSGDDVTLLPGNYTSAHGLGESTTGVTVHGAPGARPVVTFTASPEGDGFFVGAGSTLRDVDIVATSGFSINGFFADGGTVERVFSHVEQAYRACAGGNGATIRDTVCWFTGPAGPGNEAVGIFSQHAGDTATLRNVAAVAANGFGIRAVTQSGASLAVTATNVIAQGPAADLETEEATPPATTHTITLDHSNYATESELTPGDITDPGSNTNTNVPPVFVDAANGDFREAPASTGTIDLGTAAGLLGGELDLAGLSRSQGSAPDIGAYEFVPQDSPGAGGDPSGVPGSVPSPPPPIKKKKCKKQKKHHASAAKKCKKRKK